MIKTRSQLLMATMLTAVIGTAAGNLRAAQTVSLAGEWRFRRDDQKIGIEQKWFEAALAAPAAESGHIRLPGSTDEAKAGLPNPKKPTLDGLYRPNIYQGPAWYQRDLEIPATWKGKRIILFLERAHWETRVWLDNTSIGTQDSLIAPHVFDLGANLQPGKHRLTICVDNTLKINLGPFVSILYEGTQTDWNGLVGKLELRATDPVALDEVQVYPEVDRRVARVRLSITNVTGRPASGTLTLQAAGHDNNIKVPPRTVEFTCAGTRTEVQAELPMGDNVQLWDEFSPSLYDLKVSLSAKGEAAFSDEQQVTFGMRKFGRRGTQFTMNDRPIYLRGTLECAIFPLTGYPPCDVPAWQRVYRIMKSYGLNHIRFHSWCPPDAAFAAADLEGIMIQAEGPQANIPAGQDPKRDQFIEQEFQRIIRAYGNHPSFCTMTLGNEFGGQAALLTRWVDMLINADPRHLYSSASAAQTTPNRQFTEAGPRGIHGPGTDADFRSTIEKDDRPRVGHEIGQWTFYPNFDEIKKYTGVLEAKNFELVRDDLRAKGLFDLAPRIYQATGRHAMLLYKEEIEVLLRTPGHAGFSLLDLHDYPGQGTALIGPLDPFWDSKGFVAPEIHRQYCGPTVPLLRMKKRAFTTEETFDASAEIAHFGPQDLPHAQPRWSLKDDQGHELATGSLPSLELPTGKLTPLGAIHTSLAQAPAPCKLKVTVALEKTAFNNDWDNWVYPARASVEVPPQLVVSKGWDEAAKSALADGQKVLLLPAAKLANTLPGRFLPVFWSPIWFPDQKPNTMGILCDPRHPVFAQFPTEFHSNWQWYDLIQGSRTMSLGDTPVEFRPLVQVIDNFARNQKLGNLFEARVDRGRLMVCTMDLSTRLDQRPAARQFLAGLYSYLASERFQPAQELQLPTLDKLFAEPVVNSRLAKLGAKVVATDSEDSEHDHLAAYAIDGNPDSFWHTRWGENLDPMPHYLVIDLGREVNLKGFTCLPRQDMNNGRVAECEIFGSHDGKTWGEPIARAKWRNTANMQTLNFKDQVKTRYLKLVIKSEVRGQPFAAIAELDILTDDR